MSERLSSRGRERGAAGLGAGAELLLGQQMLFSGRMSLLLLLGAFLSCTTEVSVDLLRSQNNLFSSMCSVSLPIDPSSSRTYQS